MLSWPYAENGLHLYASDVFVCAEWLARNEDAREARHFALMRDRSNLTPNSRANGLGHLDMARARQLIEVNAEALGVANPPSVESMFTDRFLPPRSIILTCWPARMTRCCTASSFSSGLLMKAGSPAIADCNAGPSGCSPPRRNAMSPG